MYIRNQFYKKHEMCFTRIKKHETDLTRTMISTSQETRHRARKEHEFDFTQKHVIDFPFLNMFTSPRSISTPVRPNRLNNCQMFLKLCLNTFAFAEVDLDTCKTKSAEKMSDVFTCF